MSAVDRGSCRSMADSKRFCGITFSPYRFSASALFVHVQETSLLSWQRMRVMMKKMRGLRVQVQSKSCYHECGVCRWPMPSLRLS